MRMSAFQEHAMLSCWNMMSTILGTCIIIMSIGTAQNDQDTHVDSYLSRERHIELAWSITSG